MRVISADSHMMEPPGLWQERLDNKYKDRAPKVIQDFEGKKGYFFVVEGIRPFPLPADSPPATSRKICPKPGRRGTKALTPAAGTRSNGSKTKISTASKPKYCTLRLACRSSGLMMPDFSRPVSAPITIGSYKEFCSHSPKRLFGIALISLEDIQAGVKELERCAKKGMRGAMIWGRRRESVRTAATNMTCSGRQRRICTCRLVST